MQQSVSALQSYGKLSQNSLTLLERVDAACGELLLPEFEHYVARKFNEQSPEVLRKHRLMGVPVDQRYGGEGADVLTWALAMERLGQVGMGVVTFADVHWLLGCLTLESWATEEQKRNYLVSAARGERILAYALTEPEAGSDPASLGTSFIESGGQYVLNGSKYLISNGSIADALIVFAYPQGRSDGMCAFIVDADAPGFKVEMRLEEKLGLFTSDTAFLRLENCLVPKENLLGPKGRGLAVAYSGLLNGRIGIASGCVGVVEDCLNACKERAAQRVQHGKPIGKHQLIQRHLARIAMNLEMSRWPTYQAALKKQQYEQSPNDLKLRDEADLQSAVAKRIASECAFDSADRAVQIFGGFGYSLLSPVARHFLDTRVARIYEGTDEIMELKIASLLLGKEFEAYR